MISKWINQTWRPPWESHTHVHLHEHRTPYRNFSARRETEHVPPPLLPSSISSKKTESESGFSAAKKDSKRKREPSDGDDVEVKSPPPTPPEDDDDDGIQVPGFRSIHLLQPGAQSCLGMALLDSTNQLIILKQEQLQQQVPVLHEGKYSVQAGKSGCRKFHMFNRLQTRFKELPKFCRHILWSRWCKDKCV